MHQSAPRLGLIAAAPDDISDVVIEKSVTVAASTSEVWALWTTTEGMTSWLVKSAHIELAIGGAFEVHFLADAERGKRGSEGCQILSFRPERMLSFTWNAPPQFPDERGQHTWVVVDFTPVDGGTAVRLSHLGWPKSGLAGAGRWAEVHQYFEQAWGRLLGALVAHCARSPRLPGRG